MQSRVDRQLRALALAKACAACGARVRTIGHLTGLPPREALRLLFPDRMAVPRGRSPDSPEWYHGANLLHRAEASIVVALYRRLRDADFPASASTAPSIWPRTRTACGSPTRGASRSSPAQPAIASSWRPTAPWPARTTTARSASWCSDTGRTRGCRGRFRCSRWHCPRQPTWECYRC